MFVFGNVEFFIVEPPELSCILESFQTIQNGALIRAVTIAGISERFKSCVSEGMPCFLSSLMKDDHLHQLIIYHIRAYKQSSICIFLEFGWCKMIENILLKLVILHNFLHLSSVFPDFGKIKGPEILIEGLVFEILHDDTFFTASILK